MVNKFAECDRGIEKSRLGTREANKMKQQVLSGYIYIVLSTNKTKTSVLSSQKYNFFSPKHIECSYELQLKKFFIIINYKIL
jgi:hypothetical protein